LDPSHVAVRSDALQIRAAREQREDDGIDRSKADGMFGF
jgi:hypothetical protein